MSPLKNLFWILVYFFYHRWILNSRHPRLLKWQKARLQRSFFKFLLVRSPYYERWKVPLTENPEDWRRLLPQMNKDLLMTHLSEINTLGLTSDEIVQFALKQERDQQFNRFLNSRSDNECIPVTVGLSSGTSGHRGVFMATPREMARMSGLYLAKTLHGPIWRKRRIALFLRSNSNLYENGNGHIMQFRYFSLMQNIELQIHDLEVFAPTLIIAPPSVLRSLATFQSRGQCRLSPEEIYSCAEVLDPIDEVFIHKVFQIQIRQIYQATEGFLGVSCREGRLHLNEDFLIIDREYLDAEKLRFFPLITDLCRRGQPIVRYRLNDILTLDPRPCPCGQTTTVIQQVEGRQDDILWGQPLDSLQPPQPIYPDFLRRSVLFVDGHISDYQISQTAADLVRVGLKSEEQSSFPLIQKEITDLWQTMKCIPPRIELIELHGPEVGAKKRRIRSQFIPRERNQHD